MRLDVYGAIHDKVLYLVAVEEFPWTGTGGTVRGRLFIEETFMGIVSMERRKYTPYGERLSPPELAELLKKWGWEIKDVLAATKHQVIYGKA